MLIRLTTQSNLIALLKYLVYAKSRTLNEVEKFKTIVNESLIDEQEKNAMISYAEGFMIIGEKRGEKRVRKYIIEKMLRAKQSLAFISEITGAEIEEIQRVQYELEKQEEK